MTLGWRTRWADFIRIRSSQLAAAIFIRQHVLSWPPLTSTRDRGNNGQSIAAVSRRESEKRPGTGRMGDGRSTEDADSTGDRRRGGGRRQMLQLPGELTGGWTANGEAYNAASAGGRRGAIGQATNLWRPHERTDEFYHYSDSSPMVWSVKQWDGNRAVGRPNTDGGSLVRSKNTAAETDRRLNSLMDASLRVTKYISILILKKGIDLY